MKAVGEPDAGKPPVRFDEGFWATPELYSIKKCKAAFYSTEFLLICNYQILDKIFLYGNS